MRWLVAESLGPTGLWGGLDIWRARGLNLRQATGQYVVAGDPRRVS